MPITMGDGTLIGVETINISTSTYLNGQALAPNQSYGDSSSLAATTKFVHENATKPKIDYITASGYNVVLFLSEGKAYTASGRLNAWSANASGNGANTRSVKHATQLCIPETSVVIKVGGGVASYGYALLANGNLYTWGENQNGVLGLANITAQVIPVLAATGVVDVYNNDSNGGYNTANTRIYIKKTDGYIYASGYNANGAFGNGTTTSTTATSFVQLTGLGTNVTSFWNMGSQYGCAVAQKSDGTIWVTGYNGFGQLGINSLVNATTWTNTGTAWNNGDYTMVIKNVSGGFGFYDTVANASTFMTIHMDNGTASLMKTSGDGAYGCLGNNATTDVLVPYTPPLPAGRIKEIAVHGGGPSTVLVLMSDGSLYTWGYNAYGQCGNGLTANVLTPGLRTTGVTKLLCDNHNGNTYSYRSQSFIQKADGLYGAGWNLYGELGIGNYTQNIVSFTKVRLPRNGQCKMIGKLKTTGGANISIFVMEDNTLFATGYNQNNGVSPEQFYRETSTTGPGYTNPYYGAYTPGSTTVTTDENIANFCIPTQFRLNRGC